MTADPGDMSQGDLSKRIHFLKCEEGGNDIMCEITEKWLKEGRLEGEEKKLINLVCRKIIKGKNVKVIADELEEEPATIEPIYHAALQCAPEYDCNTIYDLLAEH